MSTKKILIVEDERVIRQSLRDTFLHAGYEVLEAPDGDTALYVARENKPDIILLDILMPHVDGLSLLGALRSEGVFGKTVPVILLTNLEATDDGIINVIAETEPAYYIVKSSMNLEDVVSKVEKILAHPRV